MLFTLALLISSPCFVIDGGEILASHLAPHVAELQKIPGDAVFGFMPRFGVRRVIPGFELAAFARKHGVNAGQSDSICVIRPSRKLAEAEVLEKLFAAAREVAGSDDIRIDLIDYSRHMLPPGEIIFSRHGWSVNLTDGVVVWRGVIQSPASTRFPFWVKAKILVQRKVVFAKDMLKSGVSIDPESVGLDVRELPLSPEIPFLNPMDVVGKLPLRTIESGQIIMRRSVLAPREVKQGEMVSVNVMRGNMHLKLEAKAESSGRRGERIFLKNPLSGQRFEAKVTGSGQAVIGEENE